MKTIIIKISRLFTAASLTAAIALTLGASLQASEVATEGAEVGKWTQDFAAASELAKEKDLPMLLNFTGSDWCGWCKLMDGDVYAKPEWEEFAATNVVLVTVDFPKDKTIVPEKFVARNELLKTQFEIQGYPTYVILESDAKTKLGKLQAGKGKTPESFIGELENVLRFRESSITAKVAELGETKGGEYRAAMDALKAAEAKLYEWFATAPPRNEENDKKFASFKETIDAARATLDSF